MRNIERLFARAKKLYGGEKCYIIAFVDYDAAKGCYTASWAAWDGVTGSGVEYTHTEHNTAEGACEAIETVTSKYPDANVHLFVNDMIAEDGEVMGG